MTIEQLASVLAMVIDDLLQMGALSIDIKGNTVGVHIQKEKFGSIPGDIVVSDRNDNKYPFKLSKNVMGVEFFCIVSEVPDEVQS